MEKWDERFECKAHFLLLKRVKSIEKQNIILTKVETFVYTVHCTYGADDNRHFVATFLYNNLVRGHGLHATYTGVHCTFNVVRATWQNYQMAICNMHIPCHYLSLFIYVVNCIFICRSDVPNIPKRVCACALHREFHKIVCVNMDRMVNDRAKRKTLTFAVTSVTATKCRRPSSHIYVFLRATPYLKYLHIILN